MIEYDGVGLAAPQVHENFQAMVMFPLDQREDGEKDEFPDPWILVNPEVTVLSKEPYGMWEGCLSLPDLKGYVERPSKVRVTALDRKGEKFDRVLEGFSAVIFQHEFDHLAGLLFVDKIKDMRRLSFYDEYLRYHAPDNKKSGEESEG
jgi:peptide deformylase